MDLKSILGYAHGSPYSNSPYLDIQTPEGAITMENTPIDLLGIDNLGNTKRMKAGRKKDYVFPGTTVREIPMGNPYYQMGGKQLFDFLFDDENEDAPKKNAPPVAPTTDDVEIQNQMQELEMQRRAMDNEQNDMLAMQMAAGNSYQRHGQGVSQGNPYTGDVLSSGQFGSQNIGERGRQIYGQLANDLGYAPVANSIYRSPEQQNALIAAGAPAVKNSYHLTGDAIDLKPEDWHKLSNEQQLFYRQNYDVVYHNNHYHIEPKQ